MRHSPLAALIVGAALGLALTGCTPSPNVSTTPEALPSATATPTVEPVVIGPTDTPPVAFGGDCSKVLAPEQIADATGLSLELQVSSANEGTSANVGALWCAWEGPEGRAVRLTIIPQAGLDGTTFPADSMKYYFEDCDADWVCAWQGGNDSIWIGLSFQSVPDMTRQSVDAWGAALGEQIMAHHSTAGDEAWIRDRNGWWPTVDCDQVAESVGAQLGLALSGEQVGYIDPPAHGHVMADLASRYSVCSLSTSDGAGMAVLSLTAGTASSSPSSPSIELGIPGVTAATTDAGYYLDGDGFALTDGTNLVWLEAASSGERSPQQIATAVAAAAASGFQL